MTAPQTNPNTEVNLERLVKIMGMTAVGNDHEALAFLRKANAMLAEVGWTWEQLLRGKVAVIASPFATLREPPERAPAPGCGASVPPKPQPRPPQAPSQAAPQPQPAAPQAPPYPHPGHRPRRKKQPVAPAFTLGELGL
jgi:hypothetical protein